MNDSQSNIKFIGISLFLCAFLSFFYCLFINPSFLSLISPDNSLAKITIKRIILARNTVFIISLTLFFAGYLFTNYFSQLIISNKIISILIGTTFLFWIILIIEISLKIIPRKTTKAILKTSIAYEPSSFSIHNLTLNQDIYDNNGNIKSKIRSGFRTSESLNSDFVNFAGKSVFIFGGSDVYDVNADFLQSWPELTDSLLGENYKVINAGVPGHSSFDAVGRILGEAHLYKPNYIILCVGGNDIKYFDELSLPNNSLLRKYPGLTNYTHKKNINYLNKILENFQIYLHLNYLLNGEDLMNMRSKKFNSEKAVIDNKAVYQFELNVSTFVALCRIIGSIPILMTQPRLVSETNSADDIKKIPFFKRAFSHKEYVKAYDKCDSIIFSISEKMEVDVIDISKHLSGKSDLYKDDIHTTKLGSKMIAEKTAELFLNIDSQKASNKTYNFVP